MTQKNDTLTDKSKLGIFVDRSLGAERVRDRFRYTLRLLHTFSFGRLGIPAGAGWKRRDAGDSVTDQKLLFDVLWCDYWQALPDIAGLYEHGLELPDGADADAEERPQIERGEVAYAHMLPMLPAPSHPEYIPEPEPEIVEAEVLPVIDEEALATEAEERANQALSVFQGDSPLWEDPQSLLTEIEETLVAVSPHHPDKLSLFQRVTFVRECFHRLEAFDEDFEHVMTTPRQPDEAWQVPWLAKASIDLQRQSEMPTPDSLKRASLPHYLSERWNAPVGDAGMRPPSVQDAGIRTPSVQNAGMRPHDDDPVRDAHVRPQNTFQGPASSPDSCF